MNIQTFLSSNLPLFQRTIFLSFLLSASTAAWADSETLRVSLSSTGVEANQNSFFPTISGDGNYVAFISFATNLVKGRPISTSDVFVRNLKTGIIKRASVDSAGKRAKPTYIFEPPSLSFNGRFVVFSSSSSNLVAGDTNKTYDIFAHDRLTGLTQRVSVSNTETEGNGMSLTPSISANGRLVAFESGANNLIPNDNIGIDVFVRDLQAGTTRRVSVNSAGHEANNISRHPSISADGRFVAFESDASNLAPGDNNMITDIFVRDLQKGTTRRVSVDSFGVESHRRSVKPSISADGRFVAYMSVPNNFLGKEYIFVHDLKTGMTKLVSVNNSGKKGNGGSFDPVISANGQWVTFASQATNFVVGDTNDFQDVFLRDLKAGTTQRISVSTNNNEGDQSSFGPGAMSADGRTAVFSSFAGNLVTDDTNGASDIFIRRRW